LINQIKNGNSLIIIDERFKLEEPLWITNCGFGFDISFAQIIEKDGKFFYPNKNGVI